MFIDLNERSKEIFCHIVDLYCNSGEAIGSRTLSEHMGAKLSPATIRNVMSQLEEAGLLFAPHTSAGRIPTEAGLKFFVNALLQVGSVSDDEKNYLHAQCHNKGQDFPNILEQAVSSLSGLSRCTSLVMTPKNESSLKHIEFVYLNRSEALVILVHQDGEVENRIIPLPCGVFPSMLQEATNYLNSRLIGRTLKESRDNILTELNSQKGIVDLLAAQVIEAGIGIWSEDSQKGALIITGQSHLLSDISHQVDLEKLRMLFLELETKENILSLLNTLIDADGVQIFIGSSHPVSEMTGASFILAPYFNKEQKIIGALGVIGPRHLNYGRIIPLVDYTAKMICKLLR